jgi:hypothetical protein
MRFSPKTFLNSRVFKRNNQSGVIIIGALIIMMFFMTVAIAVAEFSTRHYVSAKRTLVALNALSVAEAGAEEVMYKLNQDSTYTGSNGDTEFFNDSIKGRGVYSTLVSPGDLNNEKVVVSTGKIYIPATASQPLVTRKVRLILRGTEPFAYAVQSGGSGPIYLYGNTGVNAPTKIFTNDFIRIQDASVNLEGTIMAAGKDPSAAYNSLNCSIDGNNDMKNSTINVRYNVNPTCGIDTAGSTVTQNDTSVNPQSLPTIDKPGVLASITSDDVCSAANDPSYRFGGVNYQNSNGSACDVSLTRNKVYTLDGNTYIKGNLTIDGNTIQADSSLTSDVHVIVDGTITLKGNSTSVSSNTNNIAIIFVSYSIVDSNGDKTQPDAISISGNSLSLLSRFVALNGSIGFRGRGTMGAIAANSIVMDGSGNVTFQDVNGIPSNPTGWDVKFYEQIYQ